MRLAFVISAALLVGAAGCGKKKGSGWLVGEHGLMVRFDDGEPERYPLEVAGDLTAIACRGDSEAWVVGEDGVVLVTEDGGETWESVDAGTNATLRSVATDAGETVWLAGDDGTLIRSPEPGVFETIDIGDADVLSIATDASGRIAIVGTEGRITRVEEGVVIGTLAVGVPIRSVAITPDGGTVVGVGDGGKFVWSDDARLQFHEERDSETAETLRAVRLASDGTFAMAVGDGGTIVRMDEAGSRVDAHGSDLFALHMQTNHTTAVGANGTVLFSEDLGSTWESLDSGTGATFLGVDDLHGEPHL